MIRFEDGRFVLEEENLKVFSSDFPHLRDVAGEAEKAARHVRETGIQIQSAASWLRAWLKRADAAAAPKHGAAAVRNVDVAAAREAHEARVAAEREAWLRAHGLDRPATCPPDLYVAMLREEIKHMVRKGALR
jgi:hypothetical protein